MVLDPCLVGTNMGFYLHRHYIQSIFSCKKCVQPTHILDETKKDWICCLCKYKHVIVQLNLYPKPTFVVNVCNKKTRLEKAQEQY